MSEQEDLESQASFVRSPHEYWRATRILCAVIDAVIAHGSLNEAALAQVDTVILREKGEGMRLSLTERIMAGRGWTTAEDIYDQAGIPAVHRDVMNLALFQDPNHRQTGFTEEEIANYTNHPLRTIQLWIFNGRERLRKLDHGDLADLLA